MDTKASAEDLTLIVNASIQCLSQVVKKTPLSVKLLSRPPFKYIYDLVMEIKGETQYGNVDLERYLTQVPSEVKEKIAFINSIKLLVEGSVKSDEHVSSVDPRQVLAGLAPEKTNALLQKFCQLAIDSVKPATIKPATVPSQSQAKSIIYSSISDDQNIAGDAFKYKTKPEWAPFTQRVNITEEPKREQQLQETPGSQVVADLNNQLSELILFESAIEAAEDEHCTVLGETVDWKQKCLQLESEIQSYQKEIQSVLTPHKEKMKQLQDAIQVEEKKAEQLQQQISGVVQAIQDDLKCTE
ncbi:hypothetical protein MP228_005593 [Amoeboaphelidium protococcarum]|nr:hypothetical protein MP228_005593 [Amoeboaphelidium protococcarum]